MKLDLQHKQELRDRIFDEIQYWLAEGWGINDPYKIVRLVTSILDIVEKYLKDNYMDILD